MTTSAHPAATLLADGGRPLQDWLLDRLACYLERADTGRPVHTWPLNIPR